MENVIFQIMIDGKNFMPTSLTECIIEGEETQKEINKRLAEMGASLDTNISDVKKQYQTKNDNALLTKRKTVVDAINEILNRKRTNVDVVNFNKVAHRGFSAMAPENTLVAYRVAKERGFNYVETDVQITRDGKFVIFHDETLDRITDGTGRLRDKTLSELKTLKIDAGPGVDKYPNEKIATLEEFLILCKELELFPVIELTPTITWAEQNVKDFLAIVEKYDMIQNIVIISFSKEALQLVRNENDYIPFHYLADVTEENLSVCLSLKNTTISCSLEQYTNDKLNLAKSRNVKLAVWVVNKWENYLDLKSKGVLNITTDTI